MIREEHILAALKRIGQVQFERLVANLFDYGAFPDMIPQSSFLESFGVNIELQRTRKSPGRADAEVRSLDLKIEKSVDSRWANKFTRDVQKHVGEKINTFIFCTNQDTTVKSIRVPQAEPRHLSESTARTNRVTVKAEDYCKEQLRCEACFIIGINELVSRLGDQKFSHLRRQFLEIPEEHFSSPAVFLQRVRSHPGFQTSAEPSTIEAYSLEVSARLTFSPRELTIIHADGDDYSALLHALGIWADRERQSQDTIRLDYCFINYPALHSVLDAVDHWEFSPRVNSYLIVWGADEIENLAEYAKFCGDQTSLVFVTRTAMKESVTSKLKSSSARLNLREVRFPMPDQEASTVGIPVPEPTIEEFEEHESKLRSLMEATIDSLKRLEALIYFYSPLRLNNEQCRTKICAVMDIENTRLGQLTDLLVRSDVAAITGNLVWLRQPGVAKKLLSEFISMGVFPVERLV